MNRSALRAAALVLPLLGLAGTWAYTHVRAQQGTEWDVPIAGYDPRDLLRGHYVQFTYDWPGLEGEADFIYEPQLCIYGTSPTIDLVTRNQGTDCRHVLLADDYSSEWGNNLATGRLYVPQTDGAPLERKLADPKLQGIVRIRLRDDGHITPLRITFRPRPPEPTAVPATEPVPIQIREEP